MQVCVLYCKVMRLISSCHLGAGVSLVLLDGETIAQRELRRHAEREEPILARLVPHNAASVLLLHLHMCCVLVLRDAFVV